jgi:hypothetical protein
MLFFYIHMSLTVDVGFFYIHMSLTVDVVFQDYYSKALQKADAKKQKVLLRIIKRLVCILCFIFFYLI